MTASTAICNRRNRVARAPGSAATFLVLCFLTLASSALALDPSKSLTQYAHRIWGQEEGLLQPTIYSILQSRDGFLWLGTQDSLIRFDGLHFREFEDTQETALHRNLIRALREDKAGNVWAASVGGGLARISPSGTLTRFTTKNGLPSDDQFCLDSDDDGAVWSCSNRGLSKFDGKRFRSFTTADGLPSNGIRDTCRADDGVRWVSGLDFGLARSAGLRFQPYVDTYIPKKETVTALHCSRDGTVWAGTTAGLVRISAHGSTTVSVRDGLPDDSVSSIAESADGSLWVGTNDGISRLRYGSVSVYRTRDGLSHSSVLSLFEDREGTLWAGTKAGLDQFTDGKVTPYTTTEGLPTNQTGPVLEDGAGQLWVGTIGSGLTAFDGHQFRRITTSNGLIDNTILSLALDRAGDLWVGTRKGLNRLTRGAISGTYTTRNRLSGKEVRTIFSDVQGKLWVGTDRGLCYWSGSKFVPSGILPRSDENGILALAGGRTANLFISTEEPGFYTLRDGVVKSYPTDVNRSVDSYYLDSVKHEAWMGTLGSGLLRWKGGEFTHVRTKDGLYDNRIYGIVRDDHANFWLASSKGIFRISQGELDDFVDGKTGFVTSIPFSTGQLRFECQSGVQPAVARTRDGRLWFSTTNGLVMVDPNHLIPNNVPPPARITATLINGRRVRSGSGELQLGASERNLEIRYAGLSFISPEKVTFQYILDGYDKSWTDAGTRREAFFTNLPPGHFQFQVRTRNADGVWGTQPAVLRFEVEPRFYQRLWFFPSLLVFGAALVVLAYRARIRRLHATFEVVLAERNRIARELHDTLLQGLSGITMQLQALWTKLPYSQEKDTLEAIIADAGACSKEARRSLWGLRTVGSVALRFEEKLSAVAKQSIGAKPVTLLLQVQPVSLNAFPEIEYQLLRITQEVISNTLAHAKASTLRIEVKVEGTELQVAFEDDGIGFTPQEQRAPFGHFGLIGIRERADEIDARLRVTSAEGSGTRITISVPLPKAGGAANTGAEPELAHHRR
ncbi:MAG: two-component regulator propeller domain-containing protein [Bryobacteraceae bacterium]